MINQQFQAGVADKPPAASDSTDCNRILPEDREIRKALEECKVGAMRLMHRPHLTTVAPFFQSPVRNQPASKTATRTAGFGLHVQFLSRLLLLTQ